MNVADLSHVSVHPKGTSFGRGKPHRNFVKNSRTTSLK